MSYARLVLCLGAAAVVPAVAQPTDISGDWINVLTNFGQKQYARITLKQTGTTVGGSLNQMTLTGTMRDGKVEIDGRNPSGRTIKLSGTFDGSQIRGNLTGPDVKMEWLAYREKPAPASPTTHTFEPKEFHNFFSGAIPPVLHVFPGDTIKTWTVDAGGSDASGKRRSNGGNPETGPFYIEGAMPGDALAIKLVRVRLNRDSAISSPGIAGSALAPYYLRDLEKVENFNADWTIDRERGVAHLKEPTEKLKDYTVPLRPMLGCIGVAPPGDMVYRSGFLGAFGGNMDYNELREGVTLYLPVFQPGALLFVGDGHALQGDGELTATRSKLRWTSRSRSTWFAAAHAARADLASRTTIT